MIQLLIYGASVPSVTYPFSLIFIYSLERLQVLQKKIVAENPLLYLDKNQLRQIPEAILTAIDKQLTRNPLEAFFFSKSITLPFTINESQLNDIIIQLEKKQQAQAFLAYGLLLDGYIDNELPKRYEHDIDCGTQSYINYDEKRSYDAIGFYLKAAACDATLDELVDTLLWQLKIVGSPSVQTRLTQCLPPRAILPSASLYTEKLHISSSLTKPVFLQTSPILSPIQSLT